MWLPGVLDTTLRTIVSWLVLPAGIIVLSLAAIAVALATHSQRRVHRVYRSFGRMCVWVGGTDLRVRDTGDGPFRIDYRFEGVVFYVGVAF